MGTIEKRGRNSWRVGVQVLTETGWQWVRETIKLPDGMTEAKQRKEAEKALAQLTADVNAGRVKQKKMWRGYAAFLLYDYASGVDAGRIVACKKVKLACRRFLRDLERAKDPAYPWRFDEQKAARPVHFIERFLTPTRPWSCAASWRKPLPPSTKQWPTSNKGGLAVKFATIREASVELNISEDRMRRAVRNGDMAQAAQQLHGALFREKVRLWFLGLAAHTLLRFVE